MAPYFLSINFMMRYNFVILLVILKLEARDTLSYTQQIEMIRGCYHEGYYC